MRNPRNYVAAVRGNQIWFDPGTDVEVAIAFLVTCPPGTFTTDFEGITMRKGLTAGDLYAEWDQERRARVGN